MKLLTVKEIAEELKLKPSTVYGWAEQKLIPCLKINGALRFEEEAIQKWLASCKNGYTEETGRRPRKEAKN